MAEHRRRRPSSGSTRPSPRPPRWWTRNLRSPSPRASEDPNGGASTSAPSASPPDVPPPDPVLDDVDEDDTPAPPSARPEARRRREKRERRRGGDGVTFAPGTSGDASGEEDDRPRGRKDDEDDERRGGARGRTFLEWVVFIIGIALHIAVDVAIMFTPSIKSSRRGSASRTTPAGEEPPREQTRRRRRGASAAARRTTSFVPRGGARPARVSALDRADVPPSCGDTSAPRWKQAPRVPRERCGWRRAAAGRGEAARRGGGEAQEGQGTRHGTRPAGGAVAPRRRVACRVVYRESGSTRRVGYPNASGVASQNIARRGIVARAAPTQPRRSRALALLALVASSTKYQSPNGTPSEWFDSDISHVRDVEQPSEHDRVQVRERGPGEPG